MDTEDQQDNGQGEEKPLLPAVQVQPVEPSSETENQPHRPSLGRTKRQTTNPEGIVRRLRRLQEHLNVYWAELARQFGVSERTMSYWRKGEKVPLLKHQRALLMIERTHGLEGGKQ